MQNAVKAGADYIDNSRVIKIVEKADGVTTTNKSADNYEINSKIVIACDGVNGTSRVLTNTPRQDKVVTYQKFFDAKASLDKSKFYAYISKEFSEYDAWINTKNDWIVIGSIAKTLKKQNIFTIASLHFYRNKLTLKLLVKLKKKHGVFP